MFSLSSPQPSLTPIPCFFFQLCRQVFPLVAGEDEDDVKSVRSHRIKMEIPGHSLEESMEEGRVDKMSVDKVRKYLASGLMDSWFNSLCFLFPSTVTRAVFTCATCYQCDKMSSSFLSPTIRRLCRTACSTLTWNWTHLSLTAETPSWSLAKAPATPTAPRAPCALCREGSLL